MIAAQQKYINEVPLPTQMPVNTSTSIEPCEFEKLLARAMDILTARALLYGTPPLQQNPK